MNLLIYKSRSKEPTNWDLVESILNSSSRNNFENGITGVLVVTENHFLQVLEGPFEPLNATFDRIARDPRHKDIQLVSFKEITERKFADWGMHGVGLFDLNQDIKSGLIAKFGEDEGSVRLPSTPGEVMDLLYTLLSDERAANG